MDAHRHQNADITIAAQPVDAVEATGMGIFRFDRGGQIVGFEEKPNAACLAEIGSSVPDDATSLATGPDRPFVRVLVTHN